MSTNHLDSEQAHAASPLEALRGSHAIRSILRTSGFRRLYGARLAGQWSDGVFQASLAGSVLFNPQHATSPADMAASFAVLLLPYSMVGPFIGVLLDRFSRRWLMAIANLLRATVGGVVALLVFTGYKGIWFYVLALLALSFSRFFLSGLSAALPHVVPRNILVSANAFTTTSGTVISLIGGGSAILFLRMLTQNDHGYGIVAAVSVLGSLGAAVLMLTFARWDLGPDLIGRTHKVDLFEGVRGFVEGARHLATRLEATAVLCCIAAHRFIFGAVSVAIIDMFKYHIQSGGVIPTGIAGIGMALFTGGVGALLAASITPAITRVIGKNAWIVLSFGIVGAGGAALFLVDHPWALLVGTACLGFAGQGVKVCADTIVQETINESFQGRTFAVYDTAFNVAFVSGVVVAAFTLPTSGRSLVFFLTCAAVYVLVAICYRLAAAKHESPVRR